MREFGRDELDKLRDRAYMLSDENKLHPYHRKAYMRLALAIDGLDAMIARDILAAAKRELKEKLADIKKEK